MSEQRLRREYESLVKLIEMDDDQPFFINKRLTITDPPGIEKQAFSLTLVVDEQEHIQSPYRGLVLETILVFDTEYPFRPPEIRFYKVIYHPLISAYHRGLNYVYFNRDVVLKHWSVNWHDKTKITNVQQLMTFLQRVFVYPNNVNVLADPNNVLSKSDYMSKVLVDMWNDGGGDDDLWSFDMHSRFNTMKYEKNAIPKVIYDKIIQRLIAEYSDDWPQVDTDEDFWANEIAKQRSIDDQLRAYVLELKLPLATEKLCLSYLGLTICSDENVNDLYVLEAVTRRPSKYFMLVCSDGERINVPFWSCIKLFNNLDSEQKHDIPVPFKCSEIKSFLACISVKDEFKVRVHNATQNFPEYARNFPEADLETTIAQLSNISRVADFFMADRVLHECCLKITKMICKKQEFGELGTTSSSAASFKTYVKHD